MLITTSSARSSVEHLYEHDGRVRVYARAPIGCIPGALMKIIHSPFGYTALPFTEEPPVFVIGSPMHPIEDDRPGWFWIGGAVSGVLLTDQAMGMRFAGVREGMLKFHDQPFYTSCDFAYILKVSDEGYARIHLIPREISDDLG